MKTVLMFGNNGGLLGEWPVSKKANPLGMVSVDHGQENGTSSVAPSASIRRA